jgi:hypothetical protein
MKSPFDALPGQCPTGHETRQSAAIFSVAAKFVSPLPGWRYVRIGFFRIFVSACGGNWAFDWKMGEGMQLLMVRLTSHLLMLKGVR